MTVDQASSNLDATFFSKLANFQMCQLMSVDTSKLREK